MQVLMQFKTLVYKLLLKQAMDKSSWDWLSNNNKVRSSLGYALNE